MSDWINAGMGEKTAESLTPKDCEIKDLEKKEVSKNGEKIGDKLVLKVKHPDKDEPLSLSKAKYEKNGKIETTGLWIKTDGSGNIPYFSGVAFLMRHYNVQSLKDLVGKTINTTTDSNGYLTVKAY